MHPRMMRLFKCGLDILIYLQILEGREREKVSIRIMGAHSEVNLAYKILRYSKSTYRWLRYLILNPRKTVAKIMPKMEQLAKMA